MKEKSAYAELQKQILDLMLANKAVIAVFVAHKLSPELEQKLRNHRLQWLDLLIAEFEGEKS